MSWWRGNPKTLAERNKLTISRTSEMDAIALKQQTFVCFSSVLFGDCCTHAQCTLRSLRRTPPTSRDVISAIYGCRETWESNKHPDRKNTNNQKKTRCQWSIVQWLNHLDYGCVIFVAAAKSVLSKLDRVQAKALRICCGAFRMTPIPALLIEMEEFPLRLSCWEGSGAGWWVFEHCGSRSGIKWGGATLLFYSTISSMKKNGRVLWGGKIRLNWSG